MIGHVVGSYKITDKIGEGGMGEVFKGVDLMLEREVAIKRLRPEFARQPDLVERFRNEAVTLAKLNHPNVATLYSFLRQGDDFFMVMEYVPGETLDSLIRRSGALGCQQAIPLFNQALQGIGHAHQLGIVHRDIKPANVMLTQTGLIKVMDFGIARVLGTARMTRTGFLVGTVEYMSPEQIRGQETDARSDLYSLGILLYELLTGRVPFSSTSEYELMRSHVEEPPLPPRDLVPQVPIPVEQAILRALAKDPEARFQTAEEFRLVLENATRGDAALPDWPPPGYAGSSTRPSRPESHAAAGFPAGPKGTRLADEIEAPPAGLADHMPPTRLASAGHAEPSSGSVAAGAAGGQPQAAPPLTQLLSRLNWKHYTGAAALLFALVAVGVGLFGGEPEPAPPSGPPMVEPVEPSRLPAEPPWPITAEPSRIRPEPPPDLMPIDQFGPDEEMKPVADNKPVPPRRRRRKKRKRPPVSSAPSSSEAKPAPGEPTSPSEESTATPATPSIQPAAVESLTQPEQPVVSPEEQDRSAARGKEVKKKKKKKRGFGGFFKKLGGGLKKVGGALEGGKKKGKKKEKKEKKLKNPMASHLRIT